MMFDRAIRDVLTRTFVGAVLGLAAIGCVVGLIAAADSCEIEAGR